MNKFIALEQQYSANNYHPLPIVLTKGEGVYVWDDEGKRYLDMMSAYSAVSFGHANPRIVKALSEQAAKLAVVSRAFHSDKLGPFVELLCALTGQDKALPMNSGAEAVETALKAARKWAYKVKKIPEGMAEIIVCEGNFHGRTSTIVGFSSEAQYKEGFGPFSGGFKTIPYGDVNALRAAITANTAAFLVEPIQGEAGIVVPPSGYLSACADLCRQHNVLLLCDEVQTGLGRTGKLIACDHENVKPDGLILGKALGGGMLPVSAFLAKAELMNVFTPGDHGSTFGGNPLAAAVGFEALTIMKEENLPERAEKLGTQLMSQLKAIQSPLVKEVRGKGLLIGLEIHRSKISARKVCEHLMTKGILSKETHDTVIRFAPPLIITADQIDWAIQQIKDTFDDLS